MVRVGLGHDDHARHARFSAELGDTDGSLVVFMAGTGARPEEAFAADWRDVDLERRVFRVRRAFAKGRLKEYGKTTGPRRAVPLRARVVEALETVERRRGFVFPSPGRPHRHQQLARAPVDAGP